MLYPVSGFGASCLGRYCSGAKSLSIWLLSVAAAWWSRCFYLSGLLGGNRECQSHSEDSELSLMWQLWALKYPSPEVSICFCVFLKEKAAQSEGSHLGGLQGFELLRGLFPAALPLVSLGPPLAMGALQSSLGAVPFPSFLPSFLRLPRHCDSGGSGAAALHRLLQFGRCEAPCPDASHRGLSVMFAPGAS